MIHDARSVANMMIQKGLEHDNPLTPLQVIKLTYYCQAWMLAMFGRPMFNQKVQAWQHGPIIPDVYHGVKQYGSNHVLSPIKVPHEIFDDEERHILREVYKVYGKFTGLELSSMTHMKGTPWDQVRKDGPLIYNKVIDNDIIQKHYGEKLERGKDPDPAH